MMRWASVCSGIGAPEVAWADLCGPPAWVSEIEKFPSAVLAHHFPEVPNLGDMTEIDDDRPVDLLVGGTPCQSFSVAGKRLGLDDPRGNLALAFAALAKRLDARWVVWENVPGVLSSRSDDGSYDFGSFLAALQQCGYQCAWRVLDAQYFGVPQRRRRVFVVGCLGGWRPAATVLLEPESLRGDSPPSREAGQNAAPTISARTSGGGGLGTDFDCDGGLIPGHEISPALTARDYKGPLPEADLNAGGQVAVAFNWQSGGDCRGLNLRPTAQLQRDQTPAVAFDLRGRDGGSMPEDPHDTANIRASHGGSSRSYVAQNWQVRRLTPRECERLQGFPDDFTQIPWRGKPAEQCPDGPRYKALGNSMAVPVMYWIGKRIAAVDSVV
jgi:DNA (cytosine-5)-methyltransferase 1